MINILDDLGGTFNGMFHKHDIIFQLILDILPSLEILFESYQSHRFLPPQKRGCETECQSVLVQGGFHEV